MELYFLFWNSYVGFLTCMANSFWNHVIQFSSRQMDFQDIYSNLWKVKIFIGNIYSLKSNTYFWGTVMFVQDGFLYLIVTRHNLTVVQACLCSRHCTLTTCSIAAGPPCRPRPSWRCPSFSVAPRTPTCRPPACLRPARPRRGRGPAPPSWTFRSCGVAAAAYQTISDPENSTGLGRWLLSVSNLHCFQYVSLNAGTDPDPGSQINADPWGSGSWWSHRYSEVEILQLKIYLRYVGTRFQNMPKKRYKSFFFFCHLLFFFFQFNFYWIEIRIQESLLNS